MSRKTLCPLSFKQKLLCLIFIQKEKVFPFLEEFKNHYILVAYQSIQLQLMILNIYIIAVTWLFP